MLNNDVMWLKICHFLQTNHCGRQTPDWPPMISMPCRVPTDVKSGQSFVINRVWQYWESIISKLDHRRHSVFYFGHLDQLLWGKPGTMLWREFPMKRKQLATPTHPPFEWTTLERDPPAPDKPSGTYSSGFSLRKDLESELSNQIAHEFLTHRSCDR